MTAALDLLRTLVRDALAVEEGQPVEPPGLGAVAVPDLLAVVRRHRVGELLRTAAEPLALPAGLVAGLDEGRDLARPRLLLQAVETVRACALLREHGVDVLTFKGQALAVQTTGRADARGPGDVDLLVPPERVVEAHHALLAGGWALREEGRVEPGTWAWRHVSRWGNALTYAGRGADVDLHWRLEASPGAHPDFAVLHGRRAEVPLGGALLPTLAAADALRHLAAHREGWVWLRTLVDLRRLARDPAVLDGDLRPVALASLAIARATVGLPDSVPGHVHDRLDRVPRGVVERALAYHRAAVPSFGGGAGSALSFRHRLASHSGSADLRHAAVSLVLPPHAALPVRSRTAWTGVPRALALRVRTLVRSRVRRGGPCAGRPGRAA